jgi:predicted phage-related endonuclease
MERKGFIGGSDCVKIMQGNWLELWQVKVGLVESDDLSRNLAVQMGVHTEDFNLDWFSHEYGHELHNKQLSQEEEINGIPAKGTFDAMVYTESSMTTSFQQLHDAHIVEAKHTNAYNTMDKAIEYYMPQIQLYAYLADAEGTYLSVIFGNNKWECAYVSRDKEYFNSMWAVVSDFWGYVVRKEEPVGNDQPIQLGTDQIKVDDMVRRDATKDNHFVDCAYTYTTLEADAKAFESSKKDLKQMVGDNEREVYCDHLTIKRDKRGALRITRRV